MRKNNTMRAAALLLALTLITSCFVGGTFAKYVTSVNDTDNARIAHWGFKQGGVAGWPGSPYSTQFDLFDGSYNDSVVSGNGDNVVAPGTTKETDIRFEYKDSGITGVDAPEVDYNLTVTASLSAHELLNPNSDRLDWYLIYGADQTKVVYDTYEELLKGIGALVGANGEYTYSEKNGASVTSTAKYEAGTLPTFLTKDTTLTIGWEWDFENAEDADWDADDTTYGNYAATYGYADKLIFTISVVAEQVD